MYVENVGARIQKNIYRVTGLRSQEGSQVSGPDFINHAYFYHINSHITNQKSHEQNITYG